MSNRHIVRENDWESVFRRLEELVLANSGEDPFEEIFKLFVAKLYDELKNPGETLFRRHSSDTATREAINGVLRRAAQEWPALLLTSPVSLLTDEHLSVCVDAFWRHKLSDTAFEAVDAFFERLITSVAKGAKGQYFTPRHVVDFCVQMLSPQPGEIVCDPACGSAGFLIHALQYVAQGGALSVRELADYAKDCIWGFEIDQRAVRISKALMLFAGDGQTNIHRLNSLLTPQSDLFIQTERSEPFLTIEDIMRTQAKNFRGFDVILTNPPFAGELRETHILTSYDLYNPGRIVERDILFLERCVRLLKPGGRLAIVLPHNKFSSHSWTYAREWLLQQLQVVAVIGLGRNTFLPHTHQKASVLFGIKRAKPIPREDSEQVFFAISENDGKDSRGLYRLRASSPDAKSLWERADHDLGEILVAFRQFQSEHGARSQWLTFQSGR
jgi:type I restriction enzyme M protein